VTCTTSTSSGHVLDLDLYNNSLDGTVPISIENFYLLESVDFNHNLIRGTIPFTVGNLHSLESLNWKYNQLSGSIPNELGNLLDFLLSSLDLSYNSLSGNLPSFFSDQESTFTSIDLSNNPFLCPLPQDTAYTLATCLNWTILSTNIDCVSAWSPVTIEVYGSGFTQLSNVYCTLAMGDKYYFSAPAKIVNSKLITCPSLQATMNFSGCHGSVGERMVEKFQLFLATSDKDMISNGLVVNALNNRCDYDGSSDGYIVINGSAPADQYTSAYYPRLNEAVTICSLGLTNPYRCPPQLTFSSDGSSWYPQSFDSTCTESACQWAGVDGRVHLNGHSDGNCMFYVGGACYLYFQSWMNYNTPYPTAPCRNFVVGN